MLSVGELTSGSASGTPSFQLASLSLKGRYGCDTRITFVLPSSADTLRYLNLSAGRSAGSDYATSLTAALPLLICLEHLTLGRKHDFLAPVLATTRLPSKLTFSDAELRPYHTEYYGYYECRWENYADEVDAILSALLLRSTRSSFGRIEHWRTTSLCGSTASSLRTSIGPALPT